AELGAAERRALVDALAAMGRPVSVANENAQSRELPPERRVTLAMARWDAALASWRDMPDLASRWWQSLSDRPGSRDVLLMLAAMLAALAAGAAVEWSLDRLLASRRRRWAEVQPARYASRVGYASGQLGFEAI